MAILNLPHSLCDGPTQLHVNNHSTDHLLNLTSRITGLPKSDFYLLHNGKKYNPNTFVDGDIHVVPRLSGGKGGFGSMLRAIGAQIEKTTNREACRDLSGRRLRDINEERRLKNWLAQKEEREKEAIERKRKKIERLMQEPKVEIKDEEYNQQRSMLTENISDSVEAGLKAAVSNAVKRKSEEAPVVKKKPKKGFLLDMDPEFDSDAEISSSDSDDDTPGPSGITSDSKSNSGSSSGNDNEDNETPCSSGVNTVQNTETESDAVAGCSSKN